MKVHAVARTHTHTHSVWQKRDVRADDQKMPMQFCPGDSSKIKLLSNEFFVWRFFPFHAFIGITANEIRISNSNATFLNRQHCANVKMEIIISFSLNVLQYIEWLWAWIFWKFWLEFCYRINKNRYTFEFGFYFVTRS